MNKEQRKEYMRIYNLKHKESKKEYNRLYNLKNKSKIKEIHHEWYINNKDKVHAYNHRPDRKKIRMITDWRRRGILCFDFDLLYDLFLSTKFCEYCDIELDTNTKTRKCMDHHHGINDKFNVRGILCFNCNIRDVFREKISLKDSKYNIL